MHAPSKRPSNLQPAQAHPGLEAGYSKEQSAGQLPPCTQAMQLVPFQVRSLAAKLASIVTPQVRNAYLLPANFLPPSLRARLQALEQQTPSSATLVAQQCHLQQQQQAAATAPKHRCMP
jgi:hypothetical protein